MELVLVQENHYYLMKGMEKPVILSLKFKE